jgi:DNA uptake protein ComE-like DNA-binding protein
LGGVFTVRRRMASGDRQVASEWLPVELALPETEGSDRASENGAPANAGIERLLERAEQTQGALRRAEVRIEGAEERTRLTAQAESALQRATAAEAMAREAAEIADRLAAKLVVLTDRIAAQEIELERQRRQGTAFVDEHERELQPRWEPEPEVAPPPQLQHQRSQGAAFDINEATFDRLCRMGLSVSQAARLIGQRDQRGGFSSLDELDHLRGLPRDMIEMLKDAASA